MACEERGEIGRSPRQGLKVPETWVDKSEDSDEEPSEIVAA